jgi:hypothetical protein
VYQWTRKRLAEATQNQAESASESLTLLALAADSLLGDATNGSVPLIAGHKKQTGLGLCQSTGCPAQVQGLFQAYWPLRGREHASLQSEAGDHLKELYSMQGFDTGSPPPENLYSLLTAFLDHLEHTHQLKGKLKQLEGAVEVLRAAEK